MKTKIKLTHEEKGDEVFFYTYKETKKLIDSNIVIDTKEKTISNLKNFFEELLEKSFLEDECYDLTIENEANIEDVAPGVAKLIKECISIYHQALSEE